MNNAPSHNQAIAILHDNLRKHMNNQTAKTEHTLARTLTGLIALALLSVAIGAAFALAI